MMFVRLWIIMFLVLLSVCGCALDSRLNYKTIKAKPKRDTIAAAKLNRQGVEAMSKGRVEKAENLFKKALVKDVNFGPAHNNLGRIYFDQGKNYLAAWEFEYATTVMPGRSEPYNNLGMVMERVGKLEQAIEAYERANEMHPNHPEIVGNLARAWWSHDKNDQRTRELLEQLIFVDCRPYWVTWAKEQIACGKLAANDILPASALMPPASESTIPTQSITYPTPMLAPLLPVLSQ
jgi:Tfp pilus assembly protein PilF